MTIDRRKLYKMLKKRCKNPDLLWLLKVIVFHDPTKNFELQDRGGLRRYLPAHKSLFNAAPFWGLAIGNLTSQFFANVYLNALDQFVKHQLKCRFYLRYVDDFILLSVDLNELRQWQAQINQFVSEKLALAINASAFRLAPAAGGVDFAGFIVRSNYKLVRRRVVGNLKERLRNIKTKLVRETHHYIVYHFHARTLAQCEASVNSYLGHFKHAQTHRCLEKIWQEFSFLSNFFVLSFDKITRIDKPLLHRETFNRQINWLLRNFKSYVCLVQVGYYFEAYRKNAIKLAKISGLKLLENWRGFGVGCGFPQSKLGQIVSGLKEQGVPVVIVKQTGRELYKTKERMIDLVIEFPE